MNRPNIVKIMAQVDPNCLDMLDSLVIAYMGHRYHRTEAQTRQAITINTVMASSYRRKVRRAAVALIAAGFNLRAAPASPSKPTTS